MVLIAKKNGCNTTDRIAYVLCVESIIPGPMQLEHLQLQSGRSI